MSKRKSRAPKISLPHPTQNLSVIELADAIIELENRGIYIYEITNTAVARQLTSIAVRAATNLSYKDRKALNRLINIKNR